MVTLNEKTLLVKLFYQNNPKAAVAFRKFIRQSFLKDSVSKDRCQMISDSK
ncbi:hypothetical protein NPIL_14411, partial [Nephila pilipes]